MLQKTIALVVLDSLTRNTLSKLHHTGLVVQIEQYRIIDAVIFWGNVLFSIFVIALLFCFLCRISKQNNIELSSNNRPVLINSLVSNK